MGSVTTEMEPEMNTPRTPTLATLATLGIALLAGACALAPLAARAAEPQATGCATVEVNNVRPGQGFLMVSAFADAAGFGKQPTTALRVAAGEATMRFELCGLKGPEVALMLFQDLDSDGRMARNLMGMPTEPWGSSGSPGMFGPAWETGKVALDGKAIVVRMSL